ncbi:MAG: LLM class flavin-dependent oxidoreductase [Sphingomonadales bacterium]|nr:LLM class flavin-dependent oxidoreductase [Sphingomonadales bacterium]
MSFQPGGYIRTTLPLDLSGLADLDSGRYHSLWLSDHLVGLWPDSIWTPEFTDLATTSPSPHRHLDGLAVATAVAVQTRNTRIATSVVDTVRRHPAMLAQTALTIDHLSKGRFILGLGSGELENAVPYGFDFARPVSRFEEALKVIRLLWERDGPVDFEGQFFRLEHARLDAEPYEGRFPAIWIGCSGPRMLAIAGREAGGWWPVGTFTVDQYAGMLAALRHSAELAGRDPLAIETAGFLTCLIGDEGEIAEMVRQPMVKAFLLQVRGDFLKGRGFRHPMGDDWKGIHDIDPAVLTRERLLRFFSEVEPGAVLAALPHGTPSRVAEIVKGYVDAGMQVPKILDYSGMAGLAYGARSAAKVRAAEDALIALMGAGA